ncbi:MAG TPA: alpha amylase C-terminal domain-containing protein, partial [Beijerinckiaceae bacterium]|nr:alpha amylase C-terminal domain-containing protein [Beijerinckiaceae bacterium]
ERNVVAFARTSEDRRDVLVCVCNLSPVPRERYRVGLPRSGRWRELINTDSARYGGSNVGNMGGVTTVEEEAHGRPHSIYVRVPPLGTIILDRVP